MEESTSNDWKSQKLNERKEMADFEVQTWADRLGRDITFETRVIPLTMKAAQAITLHYQINVLDHKSKTLSQTQVNAIENIILEIDKMIQLMSCESVFVRLSTRSPKDAPLYEGHKKYNEMVDMIIWA